MKLYREILKLLFNRYIRRFSTGKAIEIFAENMGVVYIKLAQILATQNVGGIFTEQDRVALSKICDSCRPIPFKEIRRILQAEYDADLSQIFTSIDPQPLGSASISQVHAATLPSGEKVAIKIRRTDITRHIEHDVRQIRRLMHRFGRLVKFGNFIGGEKGLDLYLQWIFEETDFARERENLHAFTDFADNMNAHAGIDKKILAPKVYDELSTENIIVMEFIEHPTINQLPLTEANQAKISAALDSIVSASFYALLNNQPIVIHGDPHGGNIYLDPAGNVGFLDFGLNFIFYEENIEYCRTFFFAAYQQDEDKILDLVLPFCQLDQEKLAGFRDEVRRYCADIPNKTLTAYFVDLMLVCLRYEVCPPTILFCLAKSFICLNGIGQIAHNSSVATNLLKKYIAAFYVKRSLSETRDIITAGLKVMPHTLEKLCSASPSDSIVTFLSENRNLIDQAKVVFQHYEEVLKLI